MDTNELPEVVIDPDGRIITICGIGYSMSLFRALGHGGLPVGAHLKIVVRDDGVVTFQRISEGQFEA